MKQKSMLIGCIAVVGGLLLFSCGNNETTKSDSNTISPNNTTEMKPATIAVSMNYLHDSTTMKDNDESKEKESDDKKEKHEK